MKDVTAALIIRDNTVFLAQRKIGQYLESMWEFPGGKIEVGETAEGCLARELEEEFGITVQVGCFFMESIYHYVTGAIRLLAYFVDDVSGNFVPTVHDEVRWVEFGKLMEYDLAPADIPIAKALIKGGRNV